MTPLTKALREHRVATSKWLMHAAAATSQMAASAADVDKSLAVLDQQSRIFASPAWTEKLAVIRSDWGALGEPGQAADELQLFNAHSTLITKVNEFRHYVAGSTGLLLDPDSDAYYQMVIITDDLPALREGLSKVRGVIRELNPADPDLAVRIGRIDMLINGEVKPAEDRVETNLDLLDDDHPQARQAIEAGWTAAKSEMDMLRKDIGTEILAAKRAPQNQAQFISRLTTLDHMTHLMRPCSNV